MVESALAALLGQSMPVQDILTQYVKATNDGSIVEEVWTDRLIVRDGQIRTSVPYTVKDGKITLGNSRIENRQLIAATAFNVGTLALAINDGNPVTAPAQYKADNVDQGPDENHAFVASSDDPDDCAICGKDEDNGIHMGDDGKPYGSSDDQKAPMGPPPVKASAAVVALAGGVNPFKAHQFKKGGDDGKCATCGKGPGADVHDSDNDNDNDSGKGGDNDNDSGSSKTSHVVADAILLARGPDVRNIVIQLRNFDKNVGGGVDRDKLDDSDFAGKGRSFPIVKQGDVADALESIGRAGPDNYDAATLKSNILAIAKRKGFSVPDSDSSDSKKKVAASRSRATLPSRSGA